MNRGKGKADFSLRKKLHLPETILRLTAGGRTPPFIEYATKAVSNHTGRAEPLDEKKGFSILAILIGGAVIYFGKMLLSMITNMLLFGINPFTAFSLPMQGVGPRLPLSLAMALMISNTLNCVLGALVSVAGGAVAGSMASVSKAEHGLLAGLGTSLVSLLLLLRTYDQAILSGDLLRLLAPSIIILPLIPIFAWLGGRMVAGGPNKQYQGN